MGRGAADAFGLEDAPLTLDNSFAGLSGSVTYAASCSIVVAIAN
jgi:hypothetical protein